MYKENEGKYNGGNNYNQKVFELVKEGKAIPICPEQLGGLQTPRNRAEIKIYSGNFDGKLVHGDGILAELCVKNEIEVISSEDYK